MDHHQEFYLFCYFQYFFFVFLLHNNIQCKSELKNKTNYAKHIIMILTEDDFKPKIKLFQW